MRVRVSLNFDILIESFTISGGETYCFCPVRPSVCLSVTQFVSATPLKFYETW